ncbi:MAG: SusC/RagA family TonB-linked outer membrane protein [Prevotella sp.]|nr:SusC/RagA family TonB-linked outer membrane protein [Prevotella sp.]
MKKIKQFKLVSILLVMVLWLGMTTAVAAPQQSVLDKPVTLSLNRATVKDFFTQVKKQTGLDFIYSSELLRTLPRVTLKATNKPVRQVLNEVMGMINCTYDVEGNLITVTKELPKNRNRTATGTVTDDSGEVLVGVPVCIGDSKVCTVTDAEGKYILKIPSEACTLKFTYVGMEDTYIQVPAGNSIANVNVKMKNAMQLDEVVVIDNGLFTRKAESFTGAATVFNKDELRMVGNTNVLQSLKNLDPSFHFAENLAIGSNPNAMPEITLRGNSGFPDLYGEYSTNPNQPLFVVDGFETSMTKVIDMDMNRIESVTILKDAAAKAIYGSKAANGVVVIETVKPESGKLRVSYTGSLNLSFPDLSSYDLCNAAEKVEVERLAGLYDYDGYNGVIHWINANGQYAYNLQYNNLLGRVVQGIDTDWKAQPVRNAVGHKHTVYVEGGNKEFQYGIDLGYNDVAGVMKGSDRQTYSGGLTFRYHYKKLLLSDQMSVIYNRANNSPWGSFSTYTSMNPYFEPYDADGNLIKSYTLYEGTQYESQLANPMWNAFIKTKDTSNYMSVTNNMYAELRLFEGFRLTTRFTIARQENRSDVYLPPSHTNFISYTSEELLKRRGTYTYGDGSSSSYSLDVNANYSKTFAEKHLIFLNLGWSQNESSSNSMTMRAEGFPNDNFSNVGYASAYYKDSSPTSSESTVRDAGAIGAFNYSYDNRYLFDASFRLNGSSQFGSENRWGKFWALGIGWNINNEKFLKDTGVFDLLKLRASVGFTGSQNFNSYQSLATYTYYTDRYYNSAAGTYLMGMANNNLKWQRKMDRNIGLDASVFKRRLSLRFDYYNAITDDLLTNVTIPSSTGFTTYKENLGKVENKGWEAYVNARLFEQNSTRSYFNIYASLSHNSNKIKEISNALESYNNSLLRGRSTNPVLVYQEGQSMTAIRAVRSMGIDPATGQEVYIKRDGTTTFTWSSDDQVIVGDSEADIYGNCGFNASYRGFQLNVGMTYQFGGMIYNSTLVSKVENANLSNNVDHRVFTDRWTKPGDVARFKAMSDESTTYTTERFVEKNDVWNFSSINLSYDFDRIKAVRKAGFSRLRLSFDMTDIARIASMKTERGTSYPYAKSCSFSLQAIF